MKTLKLSTLLATLACALTFSSCLNNDDNVYGNSYRSYVTITGDTFDYTFHSDFGCTLKPSSQSVISVLPGLASSNVKRALVAFQLVGHEAGTELKAGETYNIDLVADPYSNYSIPTYSTINTAYSPAALDTLTSKNNGRITYVNSNIWAINGYANAELNILYDQTKPFYLNTYYKAEDVDVTNNTLYLNLYYNNNTTNPYNQGQGVFSFTLPEELYNTFQTDSINLVLKAKSSNQMGMDVIETDLKEVGRCKMARKDLLPVRAY